MFNRWVHPHIRRSLALVVLLLSVTGLVLADQPRSHSLWPTGPAPTLTIASGPITQPPGSVIPQGSSINFRDRGAHGRVALSHGRLLAAGTRTLFAEVRVTADETAERGQARAPIAFVLVLDTSGSMAGSKIQEARQAAQTMLNQMNDNDWVAVLRFSTDSQVLIPFQPVSQARISAPQAFSRMRAQGNTDIAGALRSALSLLNSQMADRTQRIVLVTDGRDTSGAPRQTASQVARRGSQRSITVSALGIGADYDDSYLADVADSGRGNYEFMNDTSALARFLSKELQETTRTTVRAVTAELRLPAGARIRDVWGATWDGGPYAPRLSFGALTAGDERRALVTLEVDTQAPGSVLPFGIRLSWYPVGDSPVQLALPDLRVEAVASPTQVDDARDLSVLASVTSVQASRREVQAAQAFERGDKAGAVQLNQQNIQDLDRAAQAATGAEADRLRAQKRQYEQHQQVYATQPPAAAPARDIGARERRNTDRASAY